MSDPIYKLISNDLLKQIHTARLQTGDRLPSERQLRHKYQASDTTVRRALEILQTGGYIEKRHGSGNYVLDKVRVGGDTVKTKVLVVGQGIFGQHVGLEKWLSGLSTKFTGVRTLVIDSPVIEPNQIRKLLAEYNCPLILLNSRNQMAAGAAEGLLTSLDKLPFLSEIIDRIPENIKWRFAGQDGDKKYYAMPYLYITSCLGINQKLAERAGLDINAFPTTWDELLDWCRRFTAWKKQNGEKGVYATSGDYRDLAGVSTRSFFFMAANGRPFSMNVTELHKALREYFTLLEALISEGHLEPVGIQTPDPFVSGKYLFSLQAHSWLPRDLHHYRPDLKTRLVPTPLPTAGRPGFSAGGTSLLAVALPPGKENTLAATLPVLQTMLEPEWYTHLSYNLGGGPADPQIYRQLLEIHPEMNPFYDAIFTTLEPHCPADSELIERLNELTMQRLNDPTQSLMQKIDAYAEFYLDKLNSNAEFNHKWAKTGTN